MKRCLDNDAGGDRGWEARARRGWGTHVSKKLYPSDAASFLPTDDFPVPIIPTRKRLEPSRASLTSAATSSAAPSAALMRARVARGKRWAASGRQSVGSERASGIEQPVRLSDVDPVLARSA